MNSITVFTVDTTIMVSIARMNIGAKVIELPDGVSIESDSGYAIIRLDDEIRDVLDDEELHCIEGIVGSRFHCYSVAFRDFTIVDRILETIVDRAIAVDNDHGFIAPIRQFLEASRRGSWDMSRD